MRLTLGIDYGGSRAAVSLVQRLRFQSAVLDFIHVIPDSTWAPPPGAVMLPTEAVLSYEDILELTRSEHQDAKALLAAVSSDCIGARQELTNNILRGNTTDKLLEHADAISSDLIAVNASREGSLIALLTGSVARGLIVAAKQSVLIARDYNQPEETIDRPLRAVLATDHSEYMERCTDKLVSFMPLGLSNLTVLSAFPESDMAGLQARLPHLAVNPGDAMRREFLRRNELLVGRLRKSFGSTSATISSKVSRESIDQAILTAMQETNAELLIVGAQGHSLLERLTIGSVSFRQAMSAPYSVLILRIDPTEIEALRNSDKQT